jgi:hypothetical protein
MMSQRKNFHRNQCLRRLGWFMWWSRINQRGS